MPSPPPPTLPSTPPKIEPPPPTKPPPPRIAGKEKNSKTRIDQHFNMKEKENNKRSNEKKNSPAPKKIASTKKTKQEKKREEIKKMQEFWKTFEKKNCLGQKTAAIVDQNVLSETQLSPACPSSDQKKEGLVTYTDIGIESSSPEIAGSKLKSEITSASNT